MGEDSMNNILKRLKSKTHHVATYLMGIGIVVDQYTPEIKQIVAEKVGVSWGVVYAVAFGIAMYVLRELTTKPIKDK